MAAKKRTPDAQRVEQFLDDLRSGMPENPLPPSPLKQLGASVTSLLFQGVAIGLAAGVGLRIVRFIAGF
jgi:hypothetical protein